MDARVKAMLAGGGLALAVAVGGVASASEAAAAGAGGTRVACGGGGAEVYLHPGARDGHLRKTRLNGDLDLGSCITHQRPSVTSGTWHLRAHAKTSCDSRTTSSGTIRNGRAGGIIRWDDGQVSRLAHGKLTGTLANARIHHAKVVGGRFKGSSVEATLLFSQNVVIRADTCSQRGLREIDGRVMSFRIEHHRR
ncbi:hypothetical protein [Actinocorallia sp. A-T 12471]|uniref:hypothetical protein n=1 Tax=Actinocorallia sp. A-T 12471 TaxID=3089813 RepID=UPI0029CB4EDD|nr:hypothetical protein [Actinocorallia sp. A-T 12471]MDX6743594.1 hypothetical protein [Actinocorallia sp. A-T 12471]